jgi:dihydrolipoamide dehydrogenase
MARSPRRGKITVKKSAAKRRRAPRRGRLSAKHIIVATGARPRVLPRARARQEADLDLFRGDGAGGAAESLLVVGSGAIGIEFASFYRTMGSDVTVVEVLPQILPVEDAEISAFARKRLREAGHQDPCPRPPVTKLEKQGRSVVATIDRRQGQARDHRIRARDLRRRRRRQRRGSRAGKLGVKTEKRLSS